MNLFDIEHADPIEHFLRPISLFHLSSLSRETADQGFTSYAQVAAIVANYSFTPDAIDETLRLLFAKRLIEDDNFSDEWPGTNANLRLTELGHYHIAELISDSIIGMGSFLIRLSRIGKDNGRRNHDR